MIEINKADLQMSSKYYPGIDIIKFIGAFLVIMIHTTPFAENQGGSVLTLNEFFKDYICRIAVPFYFVAAGFFLFKKIDCTRPDMNIIKIIVLRFSDYGLYGCFCYLPLTIINCGIYQLLLQLLFF